MLTNYRRLPQGGALFGPQELVLRWDGTESKGGAIRADSQGIRVWDWDDPWSGAPVGRASADGLGQGHFSISAAFSPSPQ
jgi:hypothetical protein